MSRRGHLLSDASVFIRIAGAQVARYCTGWEAFIQYGDFTDIFPRLLDNS
jgi:hypothetical protein